MNCPVSLKVLIFVSHTHKQTNPRMDRQNDYSTPGAQAHGVIMFNSNI